MQFVMYFEVYKRMMNLKSPIEYEASFRQACAIWPYLVLLSKEIWRWMDGFIGRQAGRETDRQIDR